VRFVAGVSKRLCAEGVPIAMFLVRHAFTVAMAFAVLELN
jgi:hypothetical protein